MQAIKKIIAGDVLYDCHKQQMGNTTMRQMACFEVRVIEVDTVTSRALCSWNYNKPTWWSERKLSKLRRTKIKPKVRPDSASAEEEG